MSSSNFKSDKISITLIIVSAIMLMLIMLFNIRFGSTTRFNQKCIDHYLQESPGELLYAQETCLSETVGWAQSNYLDQALWRF